MRVIQLLLLCAAVIATRLIAPPQKVAAAQAAAPTNARAPVRSAVHGTALKEAVVISPTTRPAATRPTTLPTTVPAARVAPTTALSPTTAPAAPDYDTPAIQALAQSLGKSEDPQVNAAAAQALASTGARAVPVLAATYKNADRDVRVQIVQIAGAMADPSASAPLLTLALQDSDGQIQLSAARQLNSGKLRQADAIVAAARAMLESDSQVNAQLFEYLRDLGEDAAPATNVLAQHLNSQSIAILSAIGPRAKAALPSLVEFYQDKRHTPQQRAVGVNAIQSILQPPSTQPSH